MLGTHNYKGALGDVTVDSADVRSHNLLPFATELGANSYSHGLFSSVTGAYSIISSNYGSNSSAASKNFGATITGSLNSIESATSSSNYSGVANSIVGTANRTANSNGSLILVPAMKSPILLPVFLLLLVIVPLPRIWQIHCVLL